MTRDLLRLASSGNVTAFLQALSTTKHVNVNDQDESGKSIIMYLCAINAENALAATLKHSPDLELKDSNKQTALHIAARCGSFLSLRLLLQQRANVRAVDIFGRTPLHWCVESGSPDVLVVLLRGSKGIDVDAGDALLISPLHIACSKGLLEQARLLLRFEASPFVRDQDGQTPFHKTFANQSTDCCSLLLKGNPALVNVKDNNGSSLLSLAAAQGNEVLCSFLLENGADPLTLDASLNNLIHSIAKGTGSIALTKLFISKGVGADALNDRHLRPIHFSIQSGHSQLTEFFLESGASPLQLDIEGRSPLVHCIINNQNATASLFLEKYHADPNTQDANKFTPLMYAAVSNNASMCTLLLQAGARVEDEDVHQQTAVFVAVLSNAFDSFHALADHGCNLLGRDEYQHSLVQLACRMNSTQFVSSLIEKEVNVNTTDVSKTTPLHEACKHSTTNATLLRALLNAGAKPDAADKFHRRPLHLAVLAGSLEATKVLVENGARLDVADVHRMTPRDLAQKHGYAAILKYLAAFDAPTLAHIQRAAIVFLQCWWRFKALRVRRLRKEQAAVKIQHSVRQYIKQSPEKRASIRQSFIKSRQQSEQPAPQVEPPLEVVEASAEPSEEPSNEPVVLEIPPSENPELQENLTVPEASLEQKKVSTNVSSRSTSRPPSQNRPRSRASSSASSTSTVANDKNTFSPMPSSQPGPENGRDQEGEHPRSALKTATPSITELLRDAGETLPKLPVPQPRPKTPPKPSEPVVLPKILGASSTPKSKPMFSTAPLSSSPDRFHQTSPSLPQPSRKWDYSTSGTLDARHPIPHQSGAIYQRPLNYDIAYPGLVGPGTSNRGQPYRKNYEEEKIRALERTLRQKNQEVEALKRSKSISDERRTERQRILAEQLQTLKTVQEQFVQIRSALLSTAPASDPQSDQRRQKGLRKQLKQALVDVAKLREETNAT